MELFETETIQDYYMPMVDNIIKRNFPEYHWKINNLPKEHPDRKGLEPLSDSEVVELYKKYKETGDFNARDRLIFSQLSLVCYITRNFHYNVNGSKLSPQDLLGFANYILVKLIDTYNPFKYITEEEYKQGGEIKKLPSYVQTFIGYALHKELKNYGLPIRLPHNRINGITASKKLISKFSNRFGREPYDGDTIIYMQDGDWYRATFNLYNKEILLEKKTSENLWQFSEKIIIQQPNKFISGNTALGDDENSEVFDLIEGDYDTSIDNTQYLLKESIKTVLNTLDLREREYIELVYFKGEIGKNIPMLLTPDYNSKKEIKRLNQTSKNSINIYITVDGTEKVFTYNVTANYHTDESRDSEIDLEYLLPISHKYQNICTTHALDNYSLIVKGEVTKIEHITSRETKILEYAKASVEGGQKISFQILYSYGEIFTSQTFNNNDQKMKRKLRQLFKNLKIHRYE